MNKVLIIGQAPPSVPQQYPYDTTLLYEMFQWIGITKESAQEMFLFDALVDEFPGYSVGGGHLIPSKSQIAEYRARSLNAKINAAEKIILLGNPAMKELRPTAKEYGIYGKYLFLPHPSRRNYSLIMDRNPEITNLLKQFLNK